jgi:DNA-binding NtrC family response regulator
LRNVLERAVTFNDTGVIQAAELEFGESLSEEAGSGKSAGPGPAGPAPPASGGSLEDLEREHIIRVLRETRGNKKKAAEVLGIERRTLYNKAKRLGIDLRSA